MNQRRHPDPYMRMLFDQLRLANRIIPNRHWTIQHRALGYFDNNNRFHPYDGFNLELRIEKIKSKINGQTRSL